MNKKDSDNKADAEHLEDLIEEEPDVSIETEQPEETKAEKKADKKAAKKLDGLQAERDELFERLQRVSADYQNYMRRAAQDQQTQVKLAKASVIRGFFPVIDHFDNALENEPTEGEAKALHDGVKIVRDEFLRVMQMAGVEQVTPSVGEVFDPERHEAMLHQPAEGVEPNCVSMVFQPGYVMGDRTLRPAKVAVAPGDAPAAPAAEPTEEDAEADDADV